jgi:asparagine synthase (glutamine-hydrolysing)
MSMAHGLEVRSPFLTGDVPQFGLTLPAPLKARLWGPGKRVLRALAAQAYGMDVARAPKQGFSVPIQSWLRAPGRALAEDLLSPASIADVASLEPAAVARVLRDHLEGRRSYGFELWGLMILVAWHRRHVQGTPARPRTANLPERVDFDAVTARARVT